MALTAAPTFTWTDENVAELKRLWAMGYSAGLVVPLIGAPTRNTVLGKVARLKLTRAVPVISRENANYGRGVPKEPKPTPIAKPKAQVKTAPLSREERQTRFQALADKALESFDTAVTATRGDEPGVLFLDRGLFQCAMPLPGWDDVPVTQKRVCGCPVKGETSWCSRCLPIVSASPSLTRFKDRQITKGAFR